MGVLKAVTNANSRVGGEAFCDVSQLFDLLYIGPLAFEPQPRLRRLCTILLHYYRSLVEREEWEWRVDGVASHKYYFYAGAAPSPQHRPRSLLFADLSIAARRSLSIKRFQWPGVRRSEAFR